MQNASRLCGAESETLSCALYTNIYGRVVSRPFAVHSMATGINTTSEPGTRNWLMGNILKATDEYSFELASNMTSLVRRNFNIDDRVRKAWFVNPGNRWNIPMSNGYQSDLLLSDKIIIVAMITLNDGDGNVLRRRLLSFSSSSSSSSASSGEMATLLSDDHGVVVPRMGRALLQSPLSASEYVSVPVKASQAEPDDGVIRDTLRSIMQEPRAGTLPTIQFNIDVPETMTRIFGVEGSPFTVLEFLVYGRFDEKVGLYNGMEQIGREFQRRMQENKQMYCPACEKVVTVFNNMQPYTLDPSEVSSSAVGGAGRRRRRNLLQAGEVPKGFGVGTYSVMLVYNKDLFNKQNHSLNFADVQNAVYSPDYALAWNGNLSETEMTVYLDKLKNNHFVLSKMIPVPSTSQKQYQ
jgi:hypothetical protein